MSEHAVNNRWASAWQMASEPARDYALRVTHTASESSDYEEAFAIWSAVKTHGIADLQQAEIAYDMTREQATESVFYPHFSEWLINGPVSLEAANALHRIAENYDRGLHLQAQEAADLLEDDGYETQDEDD